MLVLGQDGDDTAERLLSRLSQGLEDVNRKGLHPFRIGLSMGWTRLRPQENILLENLMQSADQMLYQQKGEKKRPERRKAS